MKHIDTPLRPFQFAVHQLVLQVLNGTFPPGTTLPAERLLAKELQITRPTLREALQVLATEGWFHIQHGKPTRVADYMETGSLALLSRLAAFPQWVPPTITEHLLEVRLSILPDIAFLAYLRNPETIFKHLDEVPNLEDETEKWTQFDWDLQLLFLKSAENPIFKMIFNGFGDLFSQMGVLYFSNERSRKQSYEYYQELLRAKSAEQFHTVVTKAMKASLDLWKELQIRNHRR